MNRTHPQVPFSKPSFSRELFGEPNRKQQNPEDHLQWMRGLCVELLREALDLWEQGTGKDKIDLALESGLWTVTIETTGTCRLRTFDKYLNLSSLPNRPRWHVLMQTGSYVIRHTRGRVAESKLEQLRHLVEQMQQGFASL
ncbi:MAG: hypothetical protein RRB13_13185 [bacterium]|nr:hypothetical protein [bacterium]